MRNAVTGISFGYNPASFSVFNSGRSASYSSFQQIPQQLNSDEDDSIQAQEVPDTSASDYSSMLNSAMHSRMNYQQSAYPTVPPQPPDGDDGTTDTDEPNPRGYIFDQSKEFYKPDPLVDTAAVYTQPEHLEQDIDDELNDDMQQGNTPQTAPVAGSSIRTF